MIATMSDRFLVGAGAAEAMDFAQVFRGPAHKMIASCRRKWKIYFPIEALYSCRQCLRKQKLDGRKWSPYAVYPAN